MKMIYKIVKLLAVFLLVMTLLLFGTARVMQDKVADIVLGSLNRKISTKLHVGSFRFSFLSRFPKASLELRDVLVSSSPGFDRSAFDGDYTDTLLAARNVSVEFRITDILFGKYTVESIGARAGKLNILTDTSGKINYNISIEEKKGESGELTIDLEKIHLAGFSTFYNNLASKLVISGVVKRGTIKSRISGEDISFSADGEVSIVNFRLKDFSIAREIPARINVDLLKSAEGIRFKKGDLRFDSYDFSLNGSISPDNIYDLMISVKDIDISGLLSYFPAKYKKVLSEYEPDGILKVNGKINGPLTRTSNPHVEADFSLTKGQLAHNKSKLTLNNISFDGNYSGPSGINSPAGILKIRNIRARLGSSEYSGSLSLTGFPDTYAEAALKGRVLPPDIREFFNIQHLSEARGSADMDMKLSGRISLSKELTPNDIAGMDEEGQITFHNFAIGLSNKKLTISGVNGDLVFSGPVVARNFRCIYKGQRISADGEFRNLVPWLWGRPVQMEAKANVAFGLFMPEAFMNHSTETTNGHRTAFRLPDDMILDIGFRIDSLSYKTFSTSRISGSLNYKPTLLTFKSFNMKALKGTITGNGFVFQNSNKSVLAKGIFNVSGVDVNQAFTSFQNFGQSFIKAENLAGSLSGSFSILLPMDSLLRTQIKSLTAEGKYTLIDGALVNFDPVKELSSFIELSELENIHFEKMENDFFIRNNYLYMPTMEVKSTAVDLSVNGRHSFDNDYEYHVKVLLSEILSKKRNRNKRTVTEFGDIQDDGLGRTSMLLKIRNEGEDIKVSYDMKAAANEVKDNLKSEKKNLKKMLNEEYGWFSKDTANMQKTKPEEKKPRVRVVWDDN
jgi:hypothetical protein